MNALLIALGALAGAPLRYLADRQAKLWLRTPAPAGTFAVNMLASFVLGLMAGAAGLGSAAVALLGTGFCGTLSTFSSFSYESLHLARSRHRALAAGYVATSVVAGIALAAAGFAITS